MDYTLEIRDDQDTLVDSVPLTGLKTDLIGNDTVDEHHILVPGMRLVFVNNPRRHPVPDPPPVVTPNDPGGV